MDRVARSVVVKMKMNREAVGWKEGGDEGIGSRFAQPSSRERSSE